MKKFITLAVIIILVACKSETKGDSTVKNKAEKVTKTNGTYLCKINGKDWHYTKGSGIVSRHKKTNKREAIFTFTKQLDKGKEVVQLFYDGDTNTLEEVNVHLKVPKIDGKKKTAIYLCSENILKKHPNAKMSGTIDLTNPSNASGKAEVTYLVVRFNKEDIKNDADKTISVEGLEFEGIGYSEAGKIFGSKGTSANN